MLGLPLRTCIRSSGARSTRGYAVLAYDQSGLWQPICRRRGQFYGPLPQSGSHMGTTGRRRPFPPVDASLPRMTSSIPIVSILFGYSLWWNRRQSTKRARLPGERQSSRSRAFTADGAPITATRGDGGVARYKSTSAGPEFPSLGFFVRHEVPRVADPVRPTRNLPRHESPPRPVLVVAGRNWTETQLPLTVESRSDSGKAGLPYTLLRRRRQALAMHANRGITNRLPNKTAGTKPSSGWDRIFK